MLPRLLAEFLGTGLIVSVVLGAGFMGERLGADPAVALTMNALAVGSVLFVAISSLVKVSGAHFNPIVSMAFLVRRQMKPVQTFYYILSQVAGAVSGALLANSMFESNEFFEGVERVSSGAFLSEVVASAGLIVLILLLVYQSKETLLPASVALWIFAGHIFSSSTAFANPAVTLGRMFSDSPSSISLQSAPVFIAAQITGLIIGLFVYHLLAGKKETV